MSHTLPLLELSISRQLLYEMNDYPRSFAIIVA